MAVKLNKSGLEIIEDFVRYMKTAFDDESSRLVQLVKAQLPQAREHLPALRQFVGDDETGHRQRNPAGPQGHLHTSADQPHARNRPQGQ